MSAYEEGQIAYRQGNRLSDNPYPQFTFDHATWRRGWYAAHDGVCEDGYVPE